LIQPSLSISKNWYQSQLLRNQPNSWKKDSQVTMKNQDSGKIPKFDGTNFGFWKSTMTFYLMSLGPEVWKSVTDGYKVPATPPTD